MRFSSISPRLRFIFLFIILSGLALAWYLISPIFLNVRINEDFPLSAQATDAMKIANDTSPVEIDEDMPNGAISEMVIIASGEFYDIAHEGSGTATIYQLEDGSRVLRFENFEVSNGPELHVFFTTQNPVPLRVSGGLGGRDLGALKGNIGDQNYLIPDDLDLSIYNSVVIYCVPFQVAFNAAPLISP